MSEEVVVSEKGVEEVPVSWEHSCLASFSRFLGFNTKGFEEEILGLLNRISKRR